MSPQPFYRRWIETDLTGFGVTVAESDLYILADRDLTAEAEEALRQARGEIERHIARCPDFQASLKPITAEDRSASPLITRMIMASRKTRVGPMAGVAGAVAEAVGTELLRHSKQVIVENGGDIFIKSLKDRQFGIYAGTSPLSGKIALRIRAERTPLGVCTSSGTVGHSMSFGAADAVTIIAQDTTLADAAATAVCNTVRGEGDIEAALKFSKSIEGVTGCVIVYQGKIGSIGDVELV